MNIRVKLLKADLSKLYFPNAKTCKDGSMGKTIEQELIKQGFKVSNGVIDLPELALEIKTRKSSTSADHTVGTMTHDNILHTPWENTSFNKKLQSQFRVTIDVVTGRVKEQVIIHFYDDPDINTELKQSYESAQKILKEHYAEYGEILKKYRIGGKNRKAFLEYKDGSSYAFRITPNGMKRFINMAKTAPSFNDLFES